MSANLNRVELIGRLTREPELRFTPSGAAVCSFGLATNRYTGTGEDRKEVTDFHNIVVWNQGKRTLAEICAQYLKKGSLAYIEGKLQTRTYDRDGVKQYRTEVNANDVQFLEPKRAKDENLQPELAGVGTAHLDDDVNPDDIPW